MNENKTIFPSCIMNIDEEFWKSLTMESFLIHLDKLLLFVDSKLPLITFKPIKNFRRDFNIFGVRPLFRCHHLINELLLKKRTLLLIQQEYPWFGPFYLQSWRKANHFAVRPPFHVDFTLKSRRRPNTNLFRWSDEGPYKMLEAGHLARQPNWHKIRQRSF